MDTTLVPSVDTVNVKSYNQCKSHFEYSSKISEISTFDFVEGTDIKEILVPGNSEMQGYPNNTGTDDKC